MTVGSEVRKCPCRHAMTVRGVCGPSAIYCPVALDQVREGDVCKAAAKRLARVEGRRP